jgi:hypothetical protein
MHDILDIFDVGSGDSSPLAFHDKVIDRNSPVPKVAKFMPTLWKSCRISPD